MTATALPTRPARPALSVVVPAYNEAANLPAVLAELQALLPTLSARWEVIVVDDGSRDATPMVLLPFLAQAGFRCLRLSRNFGKEAALSAGIDHAAGEVVVLMDADGQHPVALLPAMLEAWRDGADSVYTVRRSRADESLTKRVGTWLFHTIVNVGAQMEIPRGAGDFRLLDRRVVDALKSLPERNRFMKGLYAWVGFRTQALPYDPPARRSGRSSYSLRRLMALAFAGLTAFTNLPLRLWSGLGAVIAFCALGYGFYIAFDHFIEDHPVPGWPTVVTGIMFFSGVQLLSIGILGEYIGRIYDEVKQRPLYIVGSDAGFGPAVDAVVDTAAAETPSMPERAHAA